MGKYDQIRWYYAVETEIVVTLQIIIVQKT